MVPSQPIPGLPVFLPERLVEEIDRRVLTNADVAQLVGVSEKTVLRWRHGRVEPRRMHVRRMAEVFECEPLSFFGEHEEPNGKAAA